MIERTVEWLVSAAFVAAFTFGLIGILVLLGFGFQESAIAYLLAWVMLWDRRHTAKVMREVEKRHTMRKGDR